MTTSFRAAKAAHARMRASYPALAMALLAVSAAVSGTARAASANDTAHAAAAVSDDAADAAEIVVTAHEDKGAVPTGALGTRSILDTPLSIGQVDANQIARIAATTIDQAFAYDAGIRSNNSGVASGNTFSVRGLPIDRTNGYKVDGLPFPYWFQDQPVESLQAIEVLKGAGGFVYGFAPPGGVVNLITKRPTADFEATFGIQYRSSSILRELIDIGGPLDQSGNVKFRFNGVNEQGTLYNGAYNKDQLASLALTGHLTDALSWNLDGFYQRTRQDNQINSISFNTGTVKVNGVAYGPVTSLVPVDGDFEPGAKGTSKFNDIASVTGRLNYQIASDWKASVAARFATLDERFPGSLAAVFDNRGDYYSTVYNMNRLFKYYVLDATTTGKFTTGPINHEIVAGLSSLTDQFLYDNPTRNFVLGPANNSTPAVQSVSNAYVFNIDNPNNQPTIIGNPAAQYNNRPPVWTLYQEIHQRAAYISDTASYGPLSVLLGVRYTHYDEYNTNPDGSAISTFKYRPFTPIYAVTLKLPHAIRAYFSYVQALQDGAIAPATATNGGASFGPLSSHQYEAGLKSAGRWGNASLALFRIVQPSEYVDATNTFLRDGDARYQGIEFNTAIRPVDGLNLSASISYLDAKQVSGKASLIGERIPGTTSFQASAQAEYTLPFLPGVSLLGGIRHSGNALGGAATNTPSAFVYPGNTIGDLGASYALDLSGHAVVLRANVQNLTNERYWVPGATGTGISPGEPRTFSVAAQVALNGHHDGAASQVESGSGRDRHSYYVGLDAGAALPLQFKAAARNTVTDPAAPSVQNALDVHQQTGWDVDGIIGYDLGLFSAEIEAGFKRYGIGAIRYTNAAVPIEVTGQQHGAGAYDGGGRTGVLSVLFNGLINLGHKDAAWQGFVGGGVGLARISSGEWTLTGGGTPLLIGATPTAGTNTNKSVAIPTYFSNDNATAFALQGIVGLRHPITDWIDLSLKYRFFDVPGLKLRTESGNPITGKLRSNSVLAGAIFHL